MKPAVELWPVLPAYEVRWALKIVQSSHGCGLAQNLTLGRKDLSQDGTQSAGC